MKVYLIRHGQTDVNKENKIQGRHGLPLNSVGVQQAKAVSEKLSKVKFDYVFSSPQERAIQTAQIATDIKPIIDERLNVFDVGSAEGLKIDDVKMDASGEIPDTNIYSGVEDTKHYIARVYSFMDELNKKFGKKDVTILISGHMCITGCISAYFEGMPQDENFLKLSCSNAEYKVFDTLQKSKR